jgi:hypothetical protein
VSPARSALEALFREELAGEVDPVARRLAEAIRARHGAALAALVFYGSCLRRQTSEGVLDFYAVVDGYRPVYRSRLAALAAAALPPNVHYLELTGPPARAKYALISAADFARGASRASLDCRIWSRFCQPARIVWARDAEAVRALAAAAAESACTLAERALAWVPGEDAVRELQSRALWTRAFHETYRAELRSEQPASIDALYAADPARYDRVAGLALAALHEAGRIAGFERAGDTLRIEQDPRARARARRAWRVRRPIAKGLAIAGLLKTAFTFEGWLGYAVWKLERHSGRKIELSDRQRRRPLVFGWPVIFRLLRDGVLR